MKSCERLSVRLPETCHPRTLHTGKKPAQRTEDTSGCSHKDGTGKNMADRTKVYGNRTGISLQGKTAESPPTSLSQATIAQTRLYEPPSCLEMAGRDNTSWQTFLGAPITWLLYSPLGNSARQGNVTAWVTSRGQLKLRILRRAAFRVQCAWSERSCRPLLALCCLFLPQLFSLPEELKTGWARASADARGGLGIVGGGEVHELEIRNYFSLPLHSLWLTPPL